MADSGLPRAPSSPRACTSWRTRTWTRVENTFDQYVISSGNGIHRSAVLACARDPARRFTFGDAAFLVRWLEREGREAPPEDCVYSPTPSRARDPCGTTWLEPSEPRPRRARGRRRRRVGIPRRGCHASFTRRRAGRRRRRAESRRRGRRLEADGGVADRPVRARSTPAVLAHLGVPVRGGEQGAEGREAGGGAPARAGVCLTRAGSSRGKSLAHLLRRHYNVPRALDFTGERTGVDWGAAAAVLEAEAVASFEGLARGRVAMMLVGDDFRFKDAERTFAGRGRRSWRAWGAGIERERSRREAGDARARGAGREARSGSRGPRRRSTLPPRALQTRMSYPRMLGRSFRTPITGRSARTRGWDRSSTGASSSTPWSYRRRRP